MRATVLSTLCFSKTAAATAPETTGVSDLESNESNFLLEPLLSLLEELLKLRFMVKVMMMEDAVVTRHESDGSYIISMFHKLYFDVSGLGTYIKHV